MRLKTLLIIAVIIFGIGSLVSALDLKWVGTITITPDPACVGSSASFSGVFRTQLGPVTNLKVTYGIGATELGHQDYASIAQGVNTTISFNWTPPSAAANTAWFKLDPDHTTGDTDYSNNNLNQAFTPVTCGPPPTELDLKWIGTITITPDPACVGTSAWISGVFRTQLGPVSNLKVTYGIGATELGHQDYASIAQGVNTTISFNYAAPSTAATTAWFKLDPDHTTGDTDYGNNNLNLAFTPVTCGPPPTDKPNLKPNVSYSPTTFNVGDTVTFTIIVTNNGGALSVACKMTLKEGTTLKQEFNVPAMSGGGVFLAQTYAWTAVCDAVINVKVDSNSLNTESDETDNTWSKTMKCGVSKVPSYQLRGLRAVYPSIPLPDPCLSCPPWHKILKPGDPLELLDGIGTKLAGGAKFEDIKGDWLLFLKNNNGLDPNTALRRIFNKATEGGAGRFGSEANALIFQNSLNNILNQLGGAANEFFK